MPAVKNDNLSVAVSKHGGGSANIIDIRRDNGEVNLKREVESMMNPSDGPRKLPTLLLYDEKGLQLFEDVCLSILCPVRKGESKRQ